MKYALLQVYPILLLIFTFYGAGLTKGGKGSSDLKSGKVGGVSPVFMSLDQTRLIQAFACIGIILHHVTQQITSYGTYNKGPVTLLNYTGFLFTALFFFFSGFGLVTSLMTKPDYLDSFLYKRLPSVLIPFWVINALGVLLQTFVYGVHTTLSQALCQVFGITLINSNGWFIVEIVIFYLLFYVLMRLIRNRDVALILLSLAVIAFIVYCFHQGHDPQGRQIHWFRGEWWYNSTIAFLPGLWFARFKDKLTCFLNRFYVLLLPLFAVLTIVMLQLSIDYVKRGGYYQTELTLYPSAPPLALRTLITQSAACIAFVILVVLLQMRISLGNRALSFIGGISRELFLIHGYFVNRIFGSIKMNDFLRYAVVLSCSIALTALLSPLIRRLVSAVISLLSGIASSLRRAARSAQETYGKRDRRKILLFAAAAAAIALVVYPVYRSWKLKSEYASEIQALSEADTGDEVLWGRYETDPSKFGKERLTWIVIENEPGRIRLLSKFGIAGGYYHQKHEAVSWEDCDLRARLNSEEFTGIFSSHEKKHLLPVEGDLLSLLTVGEVEELFPLQQDRLCAITESAKKSGVNSDRLSHYEVWFDKQYCYSWWWLRGASGEVSITAPIVEMDGLIRLSEKPVNKPSGAIRPVIWVEVPAAAS